MLRVLSQTGQMLQEERSPTRKHAELQQLSAQSCLQSDMTNQAGCCCAWGHTTAAGEQRLG